MRPLARHRLRWFQVLLLPCQALALAVAACSASPARADWPTDPHTNLPVCTASLEQDTPVTLADGQGGAIIAWADRRAGNLDIYAQRVSAGGAPLWEPGGVAVCIAPADQQGAVLASDGAGGVIIAWMDPRDTPFDIYAQRVSAAGTIQWPVDGVAVCVAPGQQYAPRIAPDDSGGAIIAWVDRRAGYSDIYARRITASGLLQGSADGDPVCGAAFDQDSPVMVADGTGGAVIVWRDARDDGFTGHLYSQRLAGNGTLHWAPDGVLLCTAAGDQSKPTIDSDGTGGAVVAWTDTRGGNMKTYAQRITGSGALQWTTAGVVQCSGVGNEWNPAIVSDGASGAIVTWEDYRFWNVNGADLYAQRVSASGAPQWLTTGVTVCNNIYGDQLYPQIVTDGAGGAIVTWQDDRDASLSAVDVYARKLSPAGVLQWTFSGAAVSNAAGDQSMPTLAPDGSGGAIVAWQDSRNGYDDIYAQRIKTDGLLGGATVGVPSGAPSFLAIAPAGLNPVRSGSLAVRFTLPSGQAATIELFDLAGRKLSASDLGAFGEGTHTLKLAPGRGLSPGIYLVRLRQGPDTREARVVVLD